MISYHGRRKRSFAIAGKHPPIKGRLQPGPAVSRDIEQGRIVSGEELKEEKIRQRAAHIKKSRGKHVLLEKTCRAVEERPAGSSQRFLNGSRRSATIVRGLRFIVGRKWDADGVPPLVRWARTRRSRCVEQSQCSNNYFKQLLAQVHEPRLTRSARRS